MFDSAFRLYAGTAARRRAGLIALLLALAAAIAMSPAVRIAAGSPAASQPVFLPLVGNIVHQVAPDLPFDPYSTRTGKATYYAADGGGNCSFDASPGNLMVAAMNQTDYYLGIGSWLCGAYVQIDGPQGSVVVRIVDRCPECPAGNIDMSKEAFAKIANVVDGIVPISWHIVSPALSGPIVYQFKDGSSQWWTAVQIRNHRNPIYKLEYRTGAGMFKEAPRQEYNYFVESSGMAPGPYTFRVTDIYGHTLTDSGIPLTVGGEVAGKAQFPPQL